MAFIQTLGAGPVHLVGNSYGGALVLLVALHRPDLVRTVAVGEPGSIVGALVADRPDVKDIHAERAKSLAAIHDAAVVGEVERAAELLFDWVSGRTGALKQAPEGQRRRWMSNARTVGPMMSGPPNPQITCAEIRGLRPPVLLVRGERTIPYFALTTDAMAACLPAGARRVVIPGVGHVSYAPDPSGWIQALEELWASHP